MSSDKLVNFKTEKIQIKVKMKYEEIKVGDIFTYLCYKMTVISKSDGYKVITTINDDMECLTWIEDELYMLKPLKEELPEEGLLVSEGGSIVYRTSKKCGYGFDSNKDYAILNDGIFGWTFNNFPEEWRKATKQEEEKFIEMLKKKCEARGLFEDTKIEYHADGTSLIDADYMEVIPRLSLTYGYNKNGQIFYKGKFATPRKEITLELVSKAVQELGDFTIEQTESGIIILTPLKK